MIVLLLLHKTYFNEKGYEQTMYIYLHIVLVLYNEQSIFKKIYMYMIMVGKDIHIVLGSFIEVAVKLGLFRDYYFRHFPQKYIFQYLIILIDQKY